MAIKTVGIIRKVNGKALYDSKGRVRRKTYRFYPGRGGLYSMDVSMDAFLSEELRQKIEEIPKAMHSGLRKIGYVGHMYMKRDARRGGPPGERWPDRTVVTRKFPEWGSMRFGKERSEPARQFYGGLRQAIGYYRHPMPRMEVEFGFLGSAAYMEATRLQRGFVVRMSQKMRRLFIMRGFRPPKGDLKVPARNLIAPSYRARMSLLLGEFDGEVRRVWERKTGKERSG